MRVMSKHKGHKAAGRQSWTSGTYMYRVRYLELQAPGNPYLIRNKFTRRRLSELITTSYAPSTSALHVSVNASGMPPAPSA